jgi:eukaryotic-like serine/threonine-protein kinase
MFDDEAATLAPENRLTSPPTTAISGSLDGQSAPHQLPASIGRYRIIRLLGEGGMGAVYEAEQDQPRRRVALKVIKAAWASPELLHRFEQEFQTLGRLHHPGIAQIYEAGTADTGFGFQPFFAMELIDGKPLSAYAAAEHLNTRQRLALMIQICDAVQHAHQHGVIHRDLKPGNILVDETGQPKVLDFGLARVTDSDAQATRQTDMGQLLGTLAYMSPEQVVADPLALDTRSDVYALGVILYELLAGKLPYQLSRQLHEVIQTIQQVDPTPLSSIDRAYRGDIETIAAKALEKDKARRYASAADLAADIQRYLDDQPIAAKPACASYQLQKFARRHKVLVLGVATVFVVLIAGVLVSTWEAVRARRAEARAQQEVASAQAVTDFLQHDLLAQASAYNQSETDSKFDPDIKVRTALDRAAQRISGKFDKQPEVEAAVRNTIGQAYEDLRLFPQARTQVERALTLRQRTLGEENPKTLETMSLLGLIADYQGKYREAEALLSKALEISDHVLGPEHPDSLKTMSRLAWVEYDEGKYGESEALVSKSLEISRRVLGPDHPDTLIASNILANSYSAQGKYAQAEALYSQIIEISRRAHRSEHPITTIYMGNLALCYVDEGKYTQAEALHIQAMEISRRVLGPEDPDTLGIMQALPVDYMLLGKFGQAQALLNQTLIAQRRVLGPEDLSTLRTLADIAFMYQLEGTYDLAETYAAQALAGQRKTLGAESPETMDSAADLALAYQSQRKFALSEPLAREALETDRKIRPDDWQRYRAESLLGASLAGQKKYAEAEPLLLEGYQGMLARKEKIDAPDLYHLDLARKWIIQLYQAWGKPDKAAEWKAK